MTDANDPIVPAVPSRAASPLDLPAEVFRAGLDRRKQNRAALMEWIRSALVEGVDYGRIQTRRGLSKPSLWKPGAEKICGMLGVSVHFPTLHDYERAALHGAKFTHVVLRCEIRDSAGRVIADGVGARSLEQDYGDLNKALKMAEKSAHIDATLRMAGLSEVFTQDLEDMVTILENVEDQATISAEQLSELERQLEEVGGNKEAFCRYLRIDSLANLPASSYDGALKLIEAKRRKNAAAQS